MEGTRRADVRPGQRVRIIMKKDQRSGVETEGDVRDLLIKAPVHTRGIKVRLTSGEIGRVCRILEGQEQSARAAEGGRP